MNDAIINALVESYKEKGVSLHAVLADPLFKTLPLGKQVEIVQRYSQVLQKGSVAPNTSRMIGKSILKGTMAGAFASLPLALGQVPRKGMAIGLTAALGGAVLGGVLGRAQGKIELDRHNETNRYLSKIKTDRVGSAVNAIQSARNERKVEDEINKAIDPGLVGRLVERGMGYASKIL
jgi:hypothetical protein